MSSAHDGAVSYGGPYQRTLTNQLAGSTTWMHRSSEHVLVQIRRIDSEIHRPIDS